METTRKGGGSNNGKSNGSSRWFDIRRELASQNDAEQDLGGLSLRRPLIPRNAFCHASHSYCGGLHKASPPHLTVPGEVAKAKAVSSLRGRSLLLFRRYACMSVAVLSLCLLVCLLTLGYLEGASCVTGFGSRRSLSLLQTSGLAWCLETEG